jgi:hypothetical protein
MIQDGIGIIMLHGIGNLPRIVILKDIRIFHLPELILAVYTPDGPVLVNIDFPVPASIDEALKGGFDALGAIDFIEICLINAKPVEHLAAYRVVPIPPIKRTALAVYPPFYSLELLSQVDHEGALDGPPDLALAPNVVAGYSSPVNSAVFRRAPDDWSFRIEPLKGGYCFTHGCTSSAGADSGIRPGASSPELLAHKFAVFCFS